jgi:hypothetical protein
MFFVSVAGTRDGPTSSSSYSGVPPDVRREARRLIHGLLEDGAGQIDEKAQQGMVIVGLARSGGSLAATVVEAERWLGEKQSGGGLYPSVVGALLIGWQPFPAPRGGHVAIPLFKPGVDPTLAANPLWSAFETALNTFA